MNAAKPKARYQVLPLPRVQREAKKLLSASQLREGIRLAKRLRSYPETSDLALEHRAARVAAGHLLDP
jgi:hypothetical protein